MEDFQAALHHFKAAKPVKMMPVFVNHLMFLDPHKDDNKDWHRDPTGKLEYVKGGRYELISNPTKRKEFLAKALQPLLKACKGFEDVIYAWDLINEPELCVRGVPGHTARLNISDTRDFLRAGIEWIKSFRLPATVGFQTYDAIKGKDWNALALSVGPPPTIYQFHYYPAGVPAAPQLQRNKLGEALIVGEFASAKDVAWPALAVPSMPWVPSMSLEDLHPSAIVYNRLKLLEGLGYPVAFVWSADGSHHPGPVGDPRVAWNQSTQDQIRQFTSGH